jgi:hypothetical protein
MKAQNDKGGFFGTMQTRLRLCAHDLIQPYLHSRSNINVSPLNSGFTPILFLGTVYERFEE